MCSLYDKQTMKTKKIQIKGMHAKPECRAHLHLNTRANHSSRWSLHSRREGTCHTRDGLEREVGVRKEEEPKEQEMFLFASYRRIYFQIQFSLNIVRHQAQTHICLWKPGRQQKQRVSAPSVSKDQYLIFQTSSYGWCSKSPF